MYQKTETRVDFCAKHMIQGIFHYTDKEMPEIIDSFIKRGKLSRLNILAAFLKKTDKDKKNIELLIKKCNEAGFNSVGEKFS